MSGVTDWKNVDRNVGRLEHANNNGSFILTAGFICRSVGTVTRLRDGWSVI